MTYTSFCFENIIYNTSTVLYHFQYVMSCELEGIHLTFHRPMTASVLYMYWVNSVLVHFIHKSMLDETWGYQYFCTVHPPPSLNSKEQFSIIGIKLSFFFLSFFLADSVTLSMSVMKLQSVASQQSLAPGQEMVWNTTPTVLNVLYNYFCVRIRPIRN